MEDNENNNNNKTNISINNNASVTYTNTSNTSTNKNKKTIVFLTKNELFLTIFLTIVFSIPILSFLFIETSGTVMICL